MFDSLSPYPTYKPSGLSGLGQVPSDWQLMRAKRSLHEVDARSLSGREELLSVSHKTGVTPRSEKNVTMFLAESNTGHKLCQPGDVVINTMWAWMAALGVSKHFGLVSPSYGVYRPLRPDVFTWPYLDELLRTPAYRFEYTVRSSGITDSRLRLYPDEFLRIPLLCPPHEDQAAIVKFARHTDRALRRYIRAKQRMIALLAEVREVATQNALQTPGTRFRRLVSVTDRVLRPITRCGDAVYTPLGLYNHGRGIFHKPTVKGSELGDSSFYWIAEGDLVLSGQFAWEGAIAVAGREENRCIASHRYPVLCGKSDAVDSAFLFALLRTPWGQMLLGHHSRGAAGRNRPLNATSLMKESVPLPPLHVQREVASVVFAEARLRKTVVAVDTLLREYRTRLIADVFTGKLDVRAAAARLPDESSGDENISDDESPLFLDDLQADDPDLQAAPEEVPA